MRKEISVTASKDIAESHLRMMTWPSVAKNKIDVLEWCEEQFGPENKNWRVSNHYCLTLKFKRPNDAVLFALKYG